MGHTAGQFRHVHNEGSIFAAPGDDERRDQRPGRGRALSANRRDAYDETQRILAEAVRELRPLAAGNAVVEAPQLRHEQANFAEAMSPADRKQRHFRAYSIFNGSRDFLGQAKRKAKAS